MHASRLKYKVIDFWRSAKDLSGHYLVGLYHRVSDHHAFLLAGGLTFSIFICIIPLILIIFAVLGNVVESPSISGEISTFIDRVIPYADYAANVKTFVFARLDEFIDYRGVAGIIGVVGLLFAASGLFSSMRTILNMIFRVRNTGSVIVGKLRDLALVFLVLLFFLLSIMLLPALAIFKNMAANIEFLETYHLGHVQDILFTLVSFVIIWLVFYVLYFAVPHQRLGGRVVLVSSFYSALLWHIVEGLFGYYITHFFTIKRIYGTYTFLIVVAFWMYYTSLIFILGAEIGQLYRERRHEFGRD